MASPPDGQSCATCQFWISHECRRTLPGTDGDVSSTIGSARLWRICEPTYWCAFWNVPVSTVGPQGPAGPTGPQGPEGPAGPPG